MTTARRLLQAEPEPSVTDFAEQCENHLRRAEEQKLLARDMMKRAQDLINRTRADSKSRIFRKNPI